MFSVGDCVVCIDDSPYRCKPTCTHTGVGLRVNAIYRVKSFSRCGMSCGCVNLIMDDGTVGRTHRFRKLRKAKLEFEGLTERRVLVGEEV